MDWTDVRAIRVAPSIFDTIPGSTLTIDGVSQRRKLSVYDWVDAKHRHQRLDKALRARRRIKPQVLTRVLEQQSLMKCLRALGIQVDIQVGVAAPPSRGFDLGSNRHAVFALVLLAALAAYAAIEIMLPGQPMSWNMPLLVASAGAGILIAISFAIWLHKASVPVLESVVITVSLGSASGAVLYLSLRDIIW